MTTVVNKKTEKYDIDITRNGKWGNPFTHLSLDKTNARYQARTREDSIKEFENWLSTSDDDDACWIRDNLELLRDKKLGCVCKPLQCHGDIYVELLEGNKQRKLFI